MKYKITILCLFMLLTAAVCRAQEPYAVISGDTLTFYFDNNESKAGKSISSDTQWLKDSVKVIVFDKSIQNYHPVSCKDWFCNFYNLKAIEGLKYLNTEEVCDMSGMFIGCSKLESLDLSGFDTRNVEDMGYMFEGCQNLKALDLSHFDTRNVKYMNNMFAECQNLKALDLSHFDTRNVKNMGFMFRECRNLKALDLSHFDTRNLKNINRMFRGCQNLETLDLSSIVVKEDKYNDSELVSEIFEGCENLKTIFAHDWEIYNSRGVFYGCKNLCGGNGTEYFSNYFDKQFAHVDSDKNPGYFTRPGAKPFTPSPLQPYIILKDSVMTFYYGIDHTGKGKPLDDYSTNDELGVKKVVFDPSFKNYKAKSLKGYYGFFANFKNLTEIVGMDKYLNTAGVTNFEYMFLNCESLEELDLSNFDAPSRKHNMEYMFKGCKNLQTIYVNNKWLTEGDFNDMFEDCRNLYGGRGSKLDDVNWDDSRYAHVDGGENNPGFFSLKGQKYNPKEYAVYKDGVLTLYYDKPKPNNAKVYYIGAYGINAINVKKVVFDPSFRKFKPTSCSKWFDGLKNLTEIVGIKENLNTENVTALEGMFRSCSKLKVIDLSGFDIKKKVDISGMFYYCNDLETIYASHKWNVDSIYGTAFSDNPNLYGGKGTRYDYKNVDKTYARIDGGKDNPGLFTMEGQLPYSPKEEPTEKPVEQKIVEQKPVEQTTDPKPVVQEPAEQKPIEPELYEIVKDKTLTYYYDTNFARSNFEGNGCNIETVIFDKSCAKYKPNDLSYWFYGFSDLTKIVNMQKYLNTENVVNMSGMFFGCKKLEEIDLSNFDTRKVENMTDMFCECHSLKTVYTGENWNTDNVIHKTNLWFDDFKRKDQEITGYAILKDSTLTFYSGKKAPNGSFILDEKRHTPQWKNRAQEIKKVVFHKSFKKYFPTSCYEWFSGCCRLTDIVGMTENLNTEHVTDMTGMFFACCNLKTIDLSSLNTSNVESMSSMFDYCTSLESIDLSSFDTKNVKYMAFMFEGCQNLKTLDLSNFNTSNVVNMSSMFAGCTSLESLDLKNFDTKECHNMNLMFSQCSALKKVDVSSFDTQKIERWDGGFVGMFEGCESLTDLDVSNFTINSSSIDGMFMGCSSLRNLTLFNLNGGDYDEHWSGSMSSAFNGCKSLETLDLSGWDIDRPSSMNRTFANCTSLKTIYASKNWHFVYREEIETAEPEERVEYKRIEYLYDFYHVLYNCPNLIGGAGTKCNPNDFSSSIYLRIDVAEEVLHDVEIEDLDGTTTFYKEYVKQKAIPGYFTKKE